MRNLAEGDPPKTVLDEFVWELLGAGGVLSQIVSGMVEWDETVGAHPNAVPIPDAAQELLVSVLGDLEQRYSQQQLKVAAGILKEATDQICNDVFSVSPNFLESVDDEDSEAVE